MILKKYFRIVFLGKSMDKCGINLWYFLDFCKVSDVCF